MSPVALTNASNFSLRAERERLEREEEQQRRRELESKRASSIYILGQEEEVEKHNAQLKDGG